MTHLAYDLKGIRYGPSRPDRGSLCWPISHYHSKETRLQDNDSDWSLLRLNGIQNLMHRVIRATFVLIFKFELPSLCLVKWIICSKNARVISLKESWIEMLRDFLDYCYSLHFCTCTVQPFSFAECHWPFGQSMWSASLCTQDVLQWWSVRHRVRQAFHSKLVQAHCEGNKLVQVQAVMFWSHHNFPFLLSFLLPYLMTTRDFWPLHGSREQAHKWPYGGRALLIVVLLMDWLYVIPEDVGITV